MIKERSLGCYLIEAKEEEKFYNIGDCILLYVELDSTIDKIKNVKEALDFFGVKLVNIRVKDSAFLSFSIEFKDEIEFEDFFEKIGSYEHSYFMSKLRIAERDFHTGIDNRIIIKYNKEEIKYLPEKDDIIKWSGYNEIKILKSDVVCVILG